MGEEGKMKREKGKEERGEEENRDEGNVKWEKRGK
jgi:hypothetical protein